MITKTKTKNNLSSYFYNKKIELDFEDLRSKVRECKFTNTKDYLENKKQEWPASPHRIYINKGWKGWNDFLGNEWPEFEKLKKLVKGRFKKAREYSEYREENWPSAPDLSYQNKGWKTWCDFLGTEERYKVWPDFKTLRKEVRKLGFKSSIEYQKNRKKNWTSIPNKIYKNKGWKGWDDFLGKEEWLTFDELKNQVRKNKIKRIEDYIKIRKEKNWPRDPRTVYEEWTDWYDFLDKNWPEFKELRNIVITLKFKRRVEYKKNRKEGWPATPNEVYRNKGWKGWDDFLGK